MKFKNLFLLLVIGLAVCSCSSNDDFEDDNTDNVSLPSSSNNYYEYQVGDSIYRIVYKTNNDCVQETNLNITRAISGFNPDGYAQGTAVKQFEKKAAIKNHPQVPNGVYYLELWKVTTKVKIPKGYRDIELDESGVVGYADWEDVCDNYQSVKISYNRRHPDERELSFYTAVVKCNLVGQQIWEVLPMDGNKIKVPYRFIK